MYPSLQNRHSHAMDYTIVGIYDYFWCELIVTYESFPKRNLKALFENNFHYTLITQRHNLLGHLYLIILLVKF